MLRTWRGIKLNSCVLVRGDRVFFFFSSRRRHTRSLRDWSSDVYSSDLYQPFRRSRGRMGFTFSGTGLGLAITRKLVAAMGAELEVETGPTWGTRFYFVAALPPTGQR